MNSVTFLQALCIIGAYGVLSAYFGVRGAAWIAVGFLCVVAMTGHAAELPISRPSESPIAYTSQSDAAVAAIEACRDRSLFLEYGGGIYRLNGSFYFTIPVTNGQARELGVRLQIPKSATLAALFHTHPKDMTTDVSGKFSQADIDTANGMHVSSYVGVLTSHTMIVYTPVSVARTALSARN